jgi:hypothetical protein
MRLPATTYRHGCDQDRRGNNAGVSPHCFTAYPVMGGETCHYTHLIVHCLSSVTLEEGYDKARIPQFRGFGLIPPVSTRPRRLAQFDREGRTAWHRAPDHFIDSSSTSPRCPGMAGHSQGTSLQSPQQGSTKRRLKAPRRPGLLSPYKKTGRGSTTDRGQRAAGKTQDRVQHPKQSSLYSFFLSLRLGLAALSRQLVTPTQAPRCKEIQNSPPRWT